MDTMDLEVIVTQGLGNASYLVASDGDAVVVDPPRDAWRVAAVAAERGWRLTHVLETHVHNDYLSGALELRASNGIEIVAPARGRYAFAHRGMEGDDTLEVGGLRFVARATPGHTPEHLAFEVVEDGTGVPTAVFTGGSLMVGSAGRTDLLGPAALDELTSAQFRSLRALATLPDSVAVLPTHGPGSFCGAGAADRGRTSTIGAERAHNPLLAIDDEAAFRSTVLTGYHPYPTYYAQMAPLNRAGPAVLGGLPVPVRLDPAGLRAAVAAGARLVDARDRHAVARGHIPGALAVELSDSFASYLGWLLPVGTPLVLVLPEPAGEATEEAVSQLLRIGFDRIVGVLDGGMDAWAAAGGEVRSYPVATVAEVAATLSDVTAGAVTADAERPRVLDVRDPYEWLEASPVEGALTISFWDLTARIGELPRDAPIIVMCKSGARSSVAASLLDAAGFEVTAVTRGGAPDWPVSRD